MKLVFLDTETTGLKPTVHEVIDFACLTYMGGTLIRTYESKVRPQRIDLADPKALSCNGYAVNPEPWNQARTMAEVGPDIANCLQDGILVGHNIPYDMAMLESNLSRAGVPHRMSHRRVDTQALVMEHLYPFGCKSCALDKVRDFLGWGREGAHTAMGDAETVKDLFFLLWGMGPIRKLKLQMHLKLTNFRRNRK